MEQEKTSSQSFLYRFILYPEYRIARHIFFILAVLLISVGQTLTIYPSLYAIYPKAILISGCIVFVSYLGIGYLNVFFLVPRFLLKGRYFLYVCMLLVFVFIVIGLQILPEKFIYLSTGAENSRADYPPMILFLEDCSAFIVLITCLTGTAISVLFKNMLTENQRLHSIKKIHLESEVQLLKEQIYPEFLFRILHATGVLTVHNPEKSSGMLMQLSKILRYQLYDCNRERVFLHSEIRFIWDYLMLEKKNRTDFDFTITEKGNLSRILVPPLIFISFIQKILEKKKPDDTLAIELYFEVIRGEIGFTCYIEPACDLEKDDFPQVRKRLELLFESDYHLDLAGKEDVGTRQSLTLRLKHLNK